VSTDIPGPISRAYFSQRLRLHYVDWGNPEKPPLLLVHGGRDHCRNWDWVAQRLRNDWHIIAPDLRGHGDSEWIKGGVYTMSDYVCDIAQLVHQLELKPLTIIGHSLGGAITLRYTGLFPETVVKAVAIEGLGSSPDKIAERAKIPTHERIVKWMAEMRDLSGRIPRRYATFEEAVDRMQAANPHLSPERAEHLTVHGMNRNEDGTWSWKFDNYVRADRPTGLDPNETYALWARITCPTLLVRGMESWASDPEKDGRAKHFRNARVANIANAGHWVHHDQLDEFMDLVTAFLAE